MEISWGLVRNCAILGKWYTDCGCFK